MSFLDKIDSPTDLRKLQLNELKALAGELKQRILEVTSKNGGHVAPNLGTIELTIALHYVFSTPNDKIIWDVGHQCYSHKLLTGRRNRFHTLRKYKGISGFPKREESVYDVFGTGHAGTSLSAAFGLAKARDLKNENFNVIAVIGDGSAISGMALEAFNHIGDSQSNLIVILNDNAMSIGRSTGALSNYLSAITARFTATGFYQRLRQGTWRLFGKIFRKTSSFWRGWASRWERGIKSILTPGGYFEDMGFHYFGPLDGHNLKTLISFFKRLRKVQGPLLVHVHTQKGHGFKGATDDPERFHGIGPFDLETCAISSCAKESYSQVFGAALLEFAEKDKAVVTITAGMTLGTGLTEFKKRFPKRFFDFGITEEHCVTFAAGLTLEGMKPVFAVYSTFLQRAFDQLIHDVALQKLPVIFAIDRAGIVGADGPTHHGVFDLGYLRMIPNLVVAAPKDEAELRDILYTALQYNNGPFAFRFPRGSVEGVKISAKPSLLPIGSWEIINKGKRIAILGTGSGVRIAKGALMLLGRKNPTVVNARFIKPMDDKLLLQIAKSHKVIVTVEENYLAGGFGSAVMEKLESLGIQKQVVRIGLEDKFIEHGAADKLLELSGLSAVNLAKVVASLWLAKK